MDLNGDEADDADFGKHGAFHYIGTRIRKDEALVWYSGSGNQWYRNGYTKQLSLVAGFLPHHDLFILDFQ